MAAVTALGLAGLNVTMPHKEDVAGACDDLSADAAALRSVNTVVARPGGRTLGDSTDGPGFLDALADEGIAVDGQPVLVLGAGGAARAVVLALGRAGASVTVAARRPEAAKSAAALAPGARAVPLGAVVAPPGPSPAGSSIPGAAGASPRSPTRALHCRTSSGRPGPAAERTRSPATGVRPAYRRAAHIKTFAVRASGKQGHASSWSE